MGQFDNERSNGGQPLRVITLGRWSAAIFLDRVGSRYSVNVRRTMSREEANSKATRTENIILFEEETLTVSELTRLAFNWIAARKLE